MKKLRLAYRMTFIFFKEFFATKIIKGTIRNTKKFRVYTSR